VFCASGAIGCSHDDAPRNDDLDDLTRATAASLNSPLALRARSTGHGYVVTYSPKVFIPLTKLCRDRCGYCTFAQAPAHVASPYLSLDEVMAVAQAGRDAGCTEALFTLGERPELRYDEAARGSPRGGTSSTVDYVANAAQMVLESTGLLPHANAGALYRHELAQLREVSASQGMMLESARGPSGAPSRARQGRRSDASTRCEFAGRAEDPLHDRDCSWASARPRRPHRTLLAIARRTRSSVTSKK
jgi:hypothetical protein